MIGLYVLPWIFGYLTSEPYGYLAGVGFCATIVAFVSFAAGAAELLVDGRWGFTLLCAYSSLLAWILIP